MARRCRGLRRCLADRQAAHLDGHGFDLLSFAQDSLGLAEVDIGRRRVPEALVVALVSVVLDEADDCLFERARQFVALEQGQEGSGWAPVGRFLTHGLQVLVTTVNLARRPWASDRCRLPWRTWGWIAVPRPLEPMVCCLLCP